MKHIVELKYTNPSHEHVSLRRRVETVNRVVEAQSPEEALNRAANQQRALGFRIQSANIVEQKIEESKIELISEAVVEEFGSDKRDAGYKMSPAVKAAQAKSDALSKVQKPVQAGTLAALKRKQMKKEEVEQVDEGKIAKALAVGAMSLASMGAKAHTDTTKSVAQLAAERPALAQRLHDIGATGQVPASDKRAAELQRKQDQEMPASERRAKELKKEEVELDEAQKKLKPSYWRAEWRLGTQTEVDKNNKKIFDKLAKTDPVKAAAFHDNLMKMKKKDVKEAADPGSMKVVNKKVKAAEKMISIAKGKVNKVDMKPSIDLEKHKSSE